MPRQRISRYVTGGKLAGMTLLELLVVISVLAILAALLFPVLGMIRESSNKIECISNLRSIGLGHLSYRSEHNGQMPPLRGSPVAAFWPYVFVGQEDYHPWFSSPKHPENIRLRVISTCPSTDRRQPSSGARTYDYLSNVETFSGVSSVSFSAAERKVAAAADNPAKLIVAADASLEEWPSNNGASGQFMIVGNRQWTGDGENIRRLFGTHHNGRFNAVFFDGHVESMKPEDLTEENIILRPNSP